MINEAVARYMCYLKTDYRHEYKYLVSEADLTLLRARILPLMRRDVHQLRSDGYRVRSVYFDDIDDRFLRENLEGLDSRIKYRIRAYDLDERYICLETKYKRNNLSKKEQCVVSRGVCDDLLSGRFPSPSGGQPKPLRRLCLEAAASALRPAAVVEYFREAFVLRAGNVRVTFDRNIASSAHIGRFFDAGCPMTPALPANTHILEVKYDELIPDYLVQAMDLGDLMQTPFSKYVYGRLPL